jgi:hypothetical protein
MGASEVGQLFEPADVLARYDDQTVELRPADGHGVLVDILRDVGRSTPRTLASCPPSKCAGVAFRGKTDALAGKPRQFLALIHVIIPSDRGFWQLGSARTRAGNRGPDTTTFCKVSWSGDAAANVSGQKRSPSVRAQGETIIPSRRAFASPVDKHGQTPVP